jgi:DNA-binding MarR family transcriptional regulator
MGSNIIKEVSSSPTSSDSRFDSRAVMDSIRQIVHALERGSSAIQRELGISGAQLFVLQTLAAAGKLSINELAARSYTHQSSVSVVVSRLVEAGLVSRSAALADARRSEVSVTPAGRRLVNASPATPQERLLSAVSALPPAKLAMLRSTLEQVVISSGMAAEHPPMFFEASGPTKPEKAAAK